MDIVIYILMGIVGLIALYLIGSTISAFNKAKEENDICSMIYYGIIIIGVAIIVS